MDKKNNSSVALFCVVFGAVIFSLFLLNVNKIKNVLEETKFVESVFGQKQTETTEEKTQSPEVPQEESPLIVEKELPPAAPVTSPLIQNAEPVIDITTVTESTGSEEIAIATPKIEEPKTEPVVAAPEPVQPGVLTTQTTLYFMFIDSAGNLIRKETTRAVPVSNSPLTTTIKTLLAGPNADETSKSYMSLIPQDTSLISATVKDKVAYLNFSDDFQWNKYGVEGYFGQLIQIVYTATVYPTVDSVQFLINGQKQDYLGSEGVWIGTPLSRTSFR